MNYPHMARLIAVVSVAVHDYRTGDWLYQCCDHDNDNNTIINIINNNNNDIKFIFHLQKYISLIYFVLHPLIKSAFNWYITWLAWYVTSHYLH